MPEYKYLLDRLIFEKDEDKMTRLENDLIEYISENMIPVGYISLGYRINPKYTANIYVKNEDTVCFDAVVECETELADDDGGNKKILHWFLLNCSFKVDYKSIGGFTVHEIEQIAVNSGIYGDECNTSTDRDLVPSLIRAADEKARFDEEATAFLEKYYPEALANPMAVPIEYIVKNKMNLDVIKNFCLTDDFSVLGAVCFSDGEVKVIDNSAMKQSLAVKRGTILIDKNTYRERNLGCVNNTIAHEAYHWHRHSIYATVKCILDREETIAYRCPVQLESNKIERHASRIAPRILMPYDMFKLKAEQLFA